MQRRDAARERNVAIAKQAESDKLADIFEQILHFPDPDFGGRYDVTLREVLDATYSGALQQLTDFPELRARFQVTIGRTYLQLGETARATEIAEEAFAAASHRDWGVTRTNAMHFLAYCRDEAGDLEAARSRCS